MRRGPGSALYRENSLLFSLFAGNSLWRAVRNHWFRHQPLIEIGSYFSSCEYSRRIKGLREKSRNCLSAADFGVKLEKSGLFLRGLKLRFVFRCT
jgi:hypothetical protein